MEHVVAVRARVVFTHLGDEADAALVCAVHDDLFETRKGAATARIGKNLRIHFHICRSTRGTAHGPGRSAAFAADFELVTQQTPDRIIIHEEQDVIRRGGADLQSDAAATQVEKRRRAPAAGHAPANHAAAAAAADNESRLEDAGENGHSLGAIEQVARDGFLARAHDLIENACRLGRLIGGGAHFPGAAIASGLRGNRQ